MDWIGKTQFHQRNEALTAGQKLRTFSELGKHSHCFFEGASSMISECSGVHLPLVLRLPFELPIEGMPVSLASGEPVHRNRLGFAPSARAKLLARRSCNSLVHDGSQSCFRISQMLRE